MEDSLIYLSPSNGAGDGHDLLRGIVDGLTRKTAEIHPECLEATREIARKAAGAAAAPAGSGSSGGGDGGGDGDDAARRAPPRAPPLEAAAAPARARTLPTALLYDEAGLRLFDRITTEAADEVIFCMCWVGRGRHGNNALGLLHAHQAGGRRRRRESRTHTHTQTHNKHNAHTNTRIPQHTVLPDESRGRHPAAPRT